MHVAMRASRGGQANERRSCTKSASSQSPVLTLNSSADRHDCRTSAAARSGPRPRSRATSARRSSRRSAWIVGRLRSACDDDEVAIPGGDLVELRQHLLALCAALHPLDPLLGLLRRQVEAGHDRLLPVLRRRAPMRDGIEQRARRVGRLELGIEIRPPRGRDDRRAPLTHLGIDQPPGAVEAAAGDAGDRGRLGLAELRRVRRRASRARRARTAAGTGRAGSASGSSRGSGRARRRRARSWRRAAAPRDPSAALAASSLSRCAQSRR